MTTMQTLDSFSSLQGPGYTSDSQGQPAEARPAVRRAHPGTRDAEGEADETPDEIGDEDEEDDETDEEDEDDDEDEEDEENEEDEEDEDEDDEDEDDDEEDETAEDSDK